MMTKVLPIAKRPITVVDIKIPPETFSQDAKTGRLIVKNAKMTTRLASAVTLPISRLTKAFNFPTSWDSGAFFATSDMSLSFPVLVSCR